MQALFDAALGLNGLVRRLGQRYVVGAWTDYARWIKKNEPGEAELSKQRTTRFPHEVTISIVTPTHETPGPFLTALLESVRRQTYGRWELCVADGGSKSPEVRAVLEEAARRDQRIKVVFLPQNEGIAGNTAAALALATGEFVTFLDHDDTLAPFALFEVARAVNAEPEADVLYSDEDVIDAKGSRRTEPQFKPDWSPDALMSRNYICHLAVYRRELVERVGGVRPASTAPRTTTWRCGPRNGLEKSSTSPRCSTTGAPTAARRPATSGRSSTPLKPDARRCWHTSTAAASPAP